MKCAKSLMFDGDAGVAGVTLLFFIFLKNKKIKIEGNLEYTPASAATPALLQAKLIVKNYRGYIYQMFALVGV